MIILRYIGYFFAGAFLANGIPHLVHGISGQEFQTPFGAPSSALVNVLWSAVNFLIGYSLLVALKGIRFGFKADFWVTAAGFIALAIMLTYAFG
jgi:hypothetical protein